MNTIYQIATARAATHVPAKDLSAVEALLVGTQDGCNVYAVKRAWGHDRRSAEVRASDPGPHYYWTAVWQTMPGGSKIASFPVTRDRLRFSSARFCVNAIRETLRDREADNALAEEAMGVE